MWGDNKRNCRRKKTYSQTDAIKAAEKYLKCMGTKQSPYQCSECGKWHLTSVK